MAAAGSDVAPEELEGLRCLGRGGAEHQMAVFRRVAALAAPMAGESTSRQAPSVFSGDAEGLGDRQDAGPRARHAPDGYVAVAGDGIDPLIDRLATAVE